MMACLQDWFYAFYLSSPLELCGLGSYACITGSVSTLYECFPDRFSPPSDSLHRFTSMSCSCLSFGGHRCAPASRAQPPPSSNVLACSWDPPSTQRMCLLWRVVGTRCGKKMPKLQLKMRTGNVVEEVSKN